MTDEPDYETSTSRVWHLRTGATTGGEVHEQRVEHLAGSPFPPTHHHPAQDEHFEVEQGAMLFVVDGAEHVVTAGESLSIPRGVPHRARNASTEESAVVRWETRPAMRTADFFLTAQALGDNADVLDRALLADSFRDVFRLSGPLQTVVPVIAGLARLLGRRLPPTDAHAEH